MKMTIAQMVAANNFERDRPDNPNTMGNDEIEVAKQYWAVDRDSCIDSMKEQLEDCEPTEDYWLIFCQWCAYEYGVSIMD